MTLVFHWEKVLLIIAFNEIINCCREKVPQKRDCCDQPVLMPWFYPELDLVIGIEKIHLFDPGFKTGF
jgi:hypothetical protein